MAGLSNIFGGGDYAAGNDPGVEAPDPDRADADIPEPTKKGAPSAAEPPRPSSGARADALLAGDGVASLDDPLPR